jgi:glycosyltransferase involved in cell wall biosynthesis
MFVELARVLDRLKFVMVGYGPMADQIQRQASGVRNLRLTGTLKHKDALTLCGRAAVLVNTSLFEGFPNTLLECGAERTPIVSLSYDPDEIICKYNIGRHSRTFAQLTADTQLLVKDAKIRSTCGANARYYVESHHSPEAVRNLYERILTGE